MKKHKKTLYIVLVLIMLVLMSYIFSKRSGYQNLYDDILFLNFFKKQNEEIETSTQAEKQKQYIFTLDCKNTYFRNIDLLETIDNKTLVNEKIAPGVEGEFQIVLEANEDTNYNVIFQSKNSKPKNLKFENVETNTQKEYLEELNPELTGKINKDEKKVITIHWSWQYENTEEENHQDTLDSQNIQTYEFLIYANGQSVI